MKFSRPATSLIAAAMIGAGVSFAVADNHAPVEMREEVMKTMGQSAKTIGDMLKGETEFDAAEVNERLAAMQEAIQPFGEYFPEGTELAGENENAAGPAIWTDREGFEAQLAEFKSDIDAAVAANPQTREEVAAAFSEVAENCKACHEEYRVKK